MAQFHIAKGASKPKPLTFEEKESIVEEILGVHPKYLIKCGRALKADTWKMEADGKIFSEWNHTEHYYR